MRPRLSYANVTATLALVLSLAGASYAAFELPRHSVGRTHLKARSVDQRALAVPIAAEAAVDETTHRLNGNPAPQCPPAPEGTPPCAVAAPPPPVETLQTLRFKTREPGLLQVHALVGAIVNAGDHDGRIQLSAKINDSPLRGTINAEVPLNQVSQASYLGSSSLRAGKHVLSLQGAVTSFDTELAITPVSLQVTVLPRAATR